MDHIKLFEEFINEANYSAADFIENHKNAKTFQPNELTHINAADVITFQTVGYQDNKKNAIGSGDAAFLRKTDVFEITGFELIQPDENFYKKSWILKSVWKKIDKQGGLVKINLKQSGVVDSVIATPEWFETQSTIK